jgi:hypothetical protein
VELAEGDLAGALRITCHCHSTRYMDRHQLSPGPLAKRHRCSIEVFSATVNLAFAA